MSHLSGKDKILNVFNKHSKTSQKNRCSANSFTVGCKCFERQSNTHGQYKIKRLRSRKERSQVRGGRREASKTKSHHPHQSSKNIANVCTCCHSSCYCSSNKESTFPNTIPAAQETSIITDNRLIAHNGLFNHEVKSVDIDRLLSEQRKQEKSGQQVPERNCVVSHSSLTPHNPSPLFRKELSEDQNEVVQFAKTADPAKNQQDCWEIEKKNSHGSDVTPGQRPRQELDSSAGSCKSIFSSKHSSLDADVLKSKKTDSGMSERGRGSKLVPTGGSQNVKTINKKLKTHVTSTLEHTPKHRKDSIQQTKAYGISPSPLQYSSSPISQSINITPIRQDASCVSKSVSDIAARLCDCLHFPFLRKRNLVAQSREELLRVLQEMHGPQLQHNLLKVKRSLSFAADLPKAVTDEAFLFPADEPACQTDTAFQLSFDTQTMHKTAGRFTDPIDTSTSVLDGALRPHCFPTFCMDPEPPGASASDNLFSHSTTSCWTENILASQHRECGINRSRSKESFMFDSFENSFLNHSREFRESFGPHYDGSNIQPFSAYLAQLPDRHLAEPVRFPREPDPFVTDRYSNDQAFSSQISHPHLSNSFQSFSQLTHSSICPSIRPHNTDTTHYPPSHMLERDSAPQFSSLPSPEHWSFPPMRLY